MEALVQTQALLPLVTYPESNSEAVAVNAVAMAALLNASLHALALNAAIPDVSNALSRLLVDFEAMAHQVESKSRASGNRLLAAVAEQARKMGIEQTAASVSAPTALLGDTAAAHSRYFDYVLCGWESTNPTSAATAEALVFGSGRPTILLPELSPVGRLRNVALAWDGSRVAARAVADAAPLLRQAEQIMVLTVVDEKPLPDNDAAGRLAQGLTKRGLNAEAVAVNANDAPVAIALQDRALETGTDLLVMGAFGHSRVRDFVLGGATAGVLADLRLPVLLSH